MNVKGSERQKRDETRMEKAVRKERKGRNEETKDR